MPDADFSFEVLGDPKPQGSKRAIMPKHGTQPVVIESAGQPLKDWRRAMTDAAREARGDAPTIDAPVAVSLAFRLVAPKARRWPFPAVAPDIDKLARAALDSLTQSRVIRDDARVVQLHCTKVYEGPLEPPGLVLKLWRIR
jgi:Holliday junction resolvase RusA-like endonuclease